MRKVHNIRYVKEVIIGEIQVENTIREISLSDFLLVLFEKMREKGVRRVSGRTKLQKLIFLISTEFELSKKFNYFLHAFGPYSSTMQKEIDTLTTFHLMEERVSRKGDYLSYNYCLTRKGIHAAKRILNEMGDPTTEILDRMTERAVQLNRLTVPELVDNAYDRLNRH